MRRETQHQLVAEVLELYSQRTTTLAKDVRRVPAEHYTSEDHWRHEREAWFLGQPSVAGLSGDLPGPGDYLTYEIGGVPIVVIRGPDGVARAYENVCRHRAAPVARGRGRSARVLTCAFHGWSYDAHDGRLLARPHSCDGFDSVESSGLGLHRLATTERHGLIIIDPRRRDALEEIDVDGWLAGLDDDFASIHHESYVPFRSRVDLWQCNWKLLLDTFFESYHVFTLHRESLAPDYLGIASLAAGFGPHNRLVVPMRSILSLARKARETWQLMPHAVVQYFLAPNVILSHYHEVLAMTRFTPISASATEVMQALFTFGPVTSEDERTGHDRRFEFAHAITSREDYPEAERVHRSLASGRVEQTLVGRNEAGVSLFHAAIERQLCANGSA
jgi:phenylpropionate dioxygenase-like ring-hydroxylating dioxygenase large terminal subunit